MTTIRCFNFSVAIIIVVLVLANHQVVSRRGGSGGGKQRTTPRRTTPRTTHHQTTHAYHQENSYQVGNSPVPPSAPVLHPQNNQGPAIGFDNVNRQAANNHPIGFDNVQTQVQPPGYHPPQQPYSNGYNPPGSGGYNPQVQQPGSWNRPTSGYSPPGSHYGGYTPQGGGYNPYLAQPGSYYNNYATPGIQPQMYQPPQSNGIGAGSLLGFAGSFGGGYLLGRLTSGGHDHKDNKESSSSDKNEQQFVVHHYYHNREEIPKQITLTNNSIATCMENATKNLCVPNTFPMCLSNGTIMCVTHTRFTVPCGSNTSMACIVTALPCNSKEKSCNSGSNLSSTVVYVPCISNVTIEGQNDTSFGSNLCITAIAEPVKKLESPVPSLVNLASVLAVLPYSLYESMNITGSDNITAMTTISDIKTEMPPIKVSGS